MLAYICILLSESALTNERESIDTPRKTRAYIPNHSQVHANFVMKWSESKRDCNISIIELKDFTRNQYTAGDVGEFVPVVAFECRGCDVVGFKLHDPFEIESTGGYVWKDAELDDAEWCEYDEENDLSVMLTEFESKIEAHSGKAAGGKKGKKGKKKKG